MKKILLFLGIALIFVGCSKTPFTGRSQAKFIPIPTINSLSFSQYDAYLQENRPMKTGQEVDMVNRIGRDLVAATEVYYKAEGREKDLKNFDWEFNVIDEKTVNAFCMPGGKVVMYTGIIDVAQNEDAVAAVMGHEIAHALAHHGNERMSQGLVAQLGLASLDIALKDKPQTTRNLIMTAAGVGAQVGILLPFSRKHETEADEIGLYILAMAGYNANEAERFWKRMAAASGGRTVYRSF